MFRAIVNFNFTRRVNEEGSTPSEHLVALEEEKRVITGDFRVSSLDDRFFSFLFSMNYYQREIFRDFFW